MTKEKAIKIIKDCKEKRFKYTFCTVNEYEAALDMAIKALKREDTFLDEVLEIIESVSDDWLEDNCEWDWHGEMKSRVLSLRGEQE